MPTAKRRRPQPPDLVLHNHTHIPVLVGGKPQPLPTYISHLQLPAPHALSNALSAKHRQDVAPTLKSLSAALLCGRILKLSDYGRHGTHLQPLLYCRDTKQCPTCQLIHSHKRADARHLAMNYRGLRSFELILHFPVSDTAGDAVLQTRSAEFVKSRIQAIAKNWLNRDYTPPAKVICDFVAGIHFKSVPRMNRLQPHLHILIDTLSDTPVKIGEAFLSEFLDHIQNDLAAIGLPQASRIKIDHRGIIVGDDKQAAASKKRGYKFMTVIEHKNTQAYILRTSEQDDLPHTPVERHQLILDSRIKRTDAQARIGAPRAEKPNTFPVSPDGRLLLIPIDGRLLSFPASEYRKRLSELKTQADDFIAAAVRAANDRS